MWVLTRHIDKDLEKICVKLGDDVVIPVVSGSEIHVLFVVSAI